MLDLAKKLGICTHYVRSTYSVQRYINKGGRERKKKTLTLKREHVLLKSTKYKKKHKRYRYQLKTCKRDRARG